MILRALGACLAATALTASVAILAAPSASASIPAGSPTASVGQHLGIPAYITPTDPAWQQILAERPSFVIANVDSGPGSAVSNDWATVLDAAHAEGVTVLGYVDTGYLGGSTPVRTTRLGDTDSTSWMIQAEQDVDSWYRFYGNSIGGVFFDDGMNTCGPSGDSDAYARDYAFLSSVVHQDHPGSLTVLNPGIAVPRCFESSADVLVTFEGSAATYLDPPVDEAPRSWQRRADPDKFMNIVYDTDQDQVAAVMARSKTNNVGRMFVTDDSLPNPYDTLPSTVYWQRELAAAASTSTAVPKSVRLVVPSRVTATTVRLAWLALRHRRVAGYDVYLGGKRVGTLGRDELRGPLATLRLRGLPPATEMTFTVRARGLDAVSSPASWPVRVRTRTVARRGPGTPGGPTAGAITAGAIRLNWAPAESGAPVIGYSVTVNGARELQLPASATSAHIGGLPLGAAATFAVTATGLDGTASPPTPAISVDIPNPTPITDPAVTFGSATATFTARYNVPFAFDHVFIDTDGSSATGYQFAGIGAEYMIENSTLYRNTADTNDWAWTPISLSDGPLVSAAGGLHVWKVPSDTFADTAALTVVFSGTGSYPTYTLAPVTATRE